jgi:hypothetical protein
MFVRIPLVFAAVQAVVGMNFHSIDVDEVERHRPKPVTLESKVFTEDGLDVSKEILAEAAREEAALDAGKVAMDNEFEKIKNTAENGAELKLKDLIKYTPKLRKIDVSN